MNGRGAAYLFDAGSGQILQSFRRPDTTNTRDGFGLGVAALGSNVVVADWGTRRVTSFATCATLGEGSACDDGSVCTPQSWCQSRVCGGPTVTCTPGQCQEDGGCNAQFGRTFVPKPNGTTCDAGSSATCSEGDYCEWGICREGGNGDLDQDDVCELDDNCPYSQDPGQDDVDGDADGDACDATDVPLRIARARLTFSRPGRPDSARLHTRGSFERPELTYFDVSEGVAVTVWVGGAGPLELVWHEPECRSFGERAICKTSAGGDAVLRVAKLRASADGTPRSSLQLSVRKLVVSPLPLGAIDVALSNAPGFRYLGIDRIGTADDCKLGSAGLTCKEAADP